ncbi:polysaccharide deacetylase family protein [Cellulomonas bogoriensis]
MTDPGDVLETVECAPGAPSVVLTFDDGPHPPDTDTLLDVLAHEQVRAVFCLVGEQVVAHPDVVRRIVDQGHVLGNHSFHHHDMQEWAPDQVREDLQRTLEVIDGAAPGAPVPYFRAPFGHWGRAIPVATGLGMRPLGWQLAVGDWDPPGVGELVNGMTGVAPGGIVLLHDGGGDRSQTVEAVAALIPRLRADGWTFAVPG